jgi:hypothetical protein
MTDELAGRTGRTGRDICQHECSAEKRVESDWQLGSSAWRHRRSMSKGVRLEEDESARVM